MRRACMLLLWCLTGCLAPHASRTAAPVDQRQASPDVLAEKSQAPTEAKSGQSGLVNINIPVQLPTAGGIAPWAIAGGLALGLWWAWRQARSSRRAVELVTGGLEIAAQHGDTVNAGDVKRQIAKLECRGGPVSRILRRRQGR